MTSDIDDFGPLDSLVIEFPGGQIDPAGFAALLASVDSGHIRILDLEFVGRAEDGTGRVISATELDAQLAQFDGASSGILSDEDISWIVAEIADDSIAAVVIYEELSVLPAIAAWTAAGATVISQGPVTLTELVEALDATEKDTK